MGQKQTIITISKERATEIEQLNYKQHGLLLLCDNLSNGTKEMDAIPMDIFAMIGKTITDLNTIVEDEYLKAAPLGLDNNWDRLLGWNADFKSLEVTYTFSDDETETIDRTFIAVYENGLHFKFGNEDLDKLVMIKKGISKVINNLTTNKNFDAVAQLAPVLGSVDSQINTFIAQKLRSLFMEYSNDEFWKDSSLDERLEKSVEAWEYSSRFKDLYVKLKAIDIGNGIITLTTKDIQRLNEAING